MFSSTMVYQKSPTQQIQEKLQENQPSICLGCVWNVKVSLVMIWLDQVTYPHRSDHHQHLGRKDIPPDGWVSNAGEVLNPIYP